nr:MAG TPA: hypothetical protein [Caudoviricetes sp.]
MCVSSLQFRRVCSDGFCRGSSFLSWGSVRTNAILVQMCRITSTMIMIAS